MMSPDEMKRTYIAGFIAGIGVTLSLTLGATIDGWLPYAVAAVCVIYGFLFVPREIRRQLEPAKKSITAPPKTAQQYFDEAPRTEHTVYCPRPLCDHTWPISLEAHLYTHLVEYHAIPEGVEEG